VGPHPSPAVLERATSGALGVTSASPDPYPTNNGDYLGTAVINCVFVIQEELVSLECPIVSWLFSWLIEQACYDSVRSESSAPLGSFAGYPRPAETPEPTLDLWTFYKLRDELLRKTAAGAGYVELYDAHGPEISCLLLADPVLQDQVGESLRAWEPDLKALVLGRGTGVTVTTEKVQAARQVLDKLAASGSPEVRQGIADELAARPIEQLVGKTVDDAAKSMGVNPPTPKQVYLPAAFRDADVPGTLQARSPGRTAPGW
jgi:hypothetical protein